MLIKQEASLQKSLSKKVKLYTQFWHRSIFETFNECLDYERPFGMTGAPYRWITEPKLGRKISKNMVQ